MLSNHRVIELAETKGINPKDGQALRAFLKGDFFPSCGPIVRSLDSKFSTMTDPDVVGLLFMFWDSLTNLFPECLELADKLITQPDSLKLSPPGTGLPRAA